MKNLYTIASLQSPNFFQKLLKKEPKGNALIELNNLLATRPWNEIQLLEIAMIEEKYKVDLHDKFLDQLKELYTRYLKMCLEDNILTDKEVDELSKLRQLLVLKEYDVISIHDKFSGDIYKKTYEDALSKGIIEKSKEEFIDKLQKDLRLPDRIADKISSESRNSFMDIQLGKITEDGKISPEEWEELNAIAKNLNINLNIDEGSKAQLEKMKLYWLIENGELPIKEVDINLQKSEKCYFTINADWLENRTVTQRLNYGGVGYKVKIMKGVYYRAGTVKVQKITSEELTTVDTGKIYITNKRLIFMGFKKNSNIPISKILAITPYCDGIGVDKDSGKSPLIRVSSNADILAMVLGRVINDIQFT